MRTARVAVGALVVVLAALTGCDAPDAHRSGILPITASSASSAPSPSASVDLTAMSPAEIGAQALRLAQFRETGALHLAVLSGTVAVLDVATSYDRRNDRTLAQVQIPHSLENAPTVGLTVFDDGDRRYVGSDDCYFAISPSAPTGVGFEIDTWLSRPDGLLATIRTQSYDAYAARLRVTLPTKVAAALLGVETVDPTYRPPLSALRGRVPAEIRLGADGSFAELLVEGDDVVRRLRTTSGIAPRLLHYVRPLHGRVSDRGVTPPPTLPPASQLKASPSDCGATADI